MASYKYPIEECDVLDTDSLLAFREKRDQWISWLRGDDQHSIWNQIYNMMWNDTVYRIHVNECRRTDEAAPEPRASHNGPLGRFLDQGYIATQVLAIRRLIEREARSDIRQPISIKRILTDIRQNRYLITRQNYVAFDGLPYDPTPSRSEWYDAVATESAPNGVIGFHRMATEGPEAWTTSELLHEQFDRMSGIDACNRDRSDLMSEAVFEQISSVIAVQEINEIGIFADKFVAHASDPLSRVAVSSREIEISMEKLSTCHRALVSATEMISSQLLWDTSSSPIPTPQFDVFENIDAPWVPSTRVEELSRLWHARVREVEDW